MQILLFIMSICCFITNLIMLIANFTGKTHFAALFIYKFIAFLGTTIPIFYWLILLNILKT